MKALLDYSKIEKYIIYNDMTKGSFCKNAGISYSTLKNVENEKRHCRRKRTKNRRRPSHKSFIDYQRKKSQMTKPLSLYFYSNLC